MPLECHPGIFGNPKISGELAGECLGLSSVCIKPHYNPWLCQGGGRANEML